jgi:hypothetical protein
MDEMFPECWPKCVAGVMLVSGRNCPDDPLIMLGGVMDEMFPECCPNVLMESCK